MGSLKTGLSTPVSRRDVLRLSAVGVAGAVFAASGLSRLAHAQDGSAEPLPADTEPVQLEFASVVTDVGPLYDARLRVIDRYESEHPNVTINYVYIPYDDFFTQIRTRAIAGTPPAIAQNGYLTPQLAATGSIIPVGDYLARSGWQAADFWPAIWQLGQFKGQAYSTPFTLDTRFTYNNPGLYEQMGLGYATTWDEMLDIAKAARELGIYGWSMTFQGDINGVWETVAALVKTDGGDLIALNPDGTAYATLASQPVYETLEFLKAMLAAEAFTPGALTHSLDIGRSEFSTGQTASFRSGNWEIGILQELVDKGEMDFDFEMSHNAIKTVPGTSSGGWAWDIYKSPANPDVAWDVINYFLQPDQINEGWADALPPTRASMELPFYASNPRNAFVEEVLEYGTWVVPPVAGHLDILPTMWRYFSAALTDQATIEEAMAEGNQAVQQLLDSGHNQLVGA